MFVSMMTSRNPPFVSDDPLSSYLRDRGSDLSVDFFLLHFPVVDHSQYLVSVD